MLRVMSTSVRRSALLIAALVACGPSGRSGGEVIVDSSCEPGAIEACYTGQLGTKGVGPCKEGTRTCDASGAWGACAEQIVPSQELCGDGIDNNCNGSIDEDEDRDGDGLTTCGGDCCDSTECSAPALVNFGAFDAPGNMVDDDCNGVVDDTALLCDQGLASGSTSALDYARAIDLCQTSTPAEATWGVISATLTLADGTGAPAPIAHSIRSRFGTGVLPQGGVNMALLSTGAAAGVGDTDPAYQDFQNGGELVGNNTESAFPVGFSQLPNAPGCPAPEGSRAMDPVMLTLQIRVPTNARSFELSTNFFSAEFPEFTCSPYNDFFVVLLDSSHTGTPANPADKNLAIYQPPGSAMVYPVGVNLAHGNTGLFTQCVNGRTGCSFGATPGTITTCTSTAQLAGTGFDTAAPGQCDPGGLLGGGTGWLVTRGNVVPGEIITLRIALWDTSDHVLDSVAVVDGFRWSVDPSQPGTVILRQ